MNQGAGSSAASVAISSSWRAVRSASGTSPPELHRQLELIATLAALEPPPWFMGGYAEDALLAGAVTLPLARRLFGNWLERVARLPAAAQA